MPVSLPGQKNYRAARAALSDLSQVISEPLFFDNEESLCGRLNQPKLPKSLHKLADPGPRGADHLVTVSTRVDVTVFRKLDGARIEGLAPQRIA
jgi:hypothetical protein